MSLNLKDLAAKAGLWENGDEPTPVGPPLPNETVAVPARFASVGAPSSAPNPVYDTLVAHTSFEATDVGKVYLKYYAKLTRITDEQLRRATAMDMAANDGVDAGKIAASFDALDAQLQSETDRFSTACDARLKKDYQDPKAQADQIASQIEQLKQQEATLRAGLQPAMDAVTTKKAQFQAAWERRSLELKQQRALFTEGR